MQGRLAEVTGEPRRLILISSSGPEQPPQEMFRGSSLNP